MDGVGVGVREGVRAGRLKVSTIDTGPSTKVAMCCALVLTKRSANDPKRWKEGSKLAGVCYMVGKTS